ncbi:hypothetical protein R1flu_005046 [Riccia fluitans]|uniref:Uncharacterized protein n=1 Tax=Riccia fluitans TaxID=41844 RepID=A0ABD1YV17_9MARC
MASPQKCLSVYTIQSRLYRRKAQQRGDSQTAGDAAVSTAALLSTGSLVKLVYFSRQTEPLLVFPGSLGLRKAPKEQDRAKEGYYEEWKYP